MPQSQQQLDDLLERLIALTDQCNAADQRGIAGMKEAISNTAEFGALEGETRIVTAETRAEMRRVLAEVRAGVFTRKLLADAEAGYPRLKASRVQAGAHRIETVRRALLLLKSR